MKKLVVFILAAIFILPVVSAQENEVCLVYFTGDVCGDDCRLTDSFIDGLINEYSDTLTAIKYNIDYSQGNKNIFEAYRANYDLPSGVPLVLFGKNDYLYGRYDIYRNAEGKVFNFIKQNGTNCPLESGYIPPSELNSGSLPGSPEVFQSQEQTEEDETVEENQTVDEDITEGETVSEREETDVISVIEDVVESEYFPVWILATVIFIILIIGIGLWFGKVRK